MDHNKYVRYIMYHPFQPQEYVIQVMWKGEAAKNKERSGLELAELPWER